MSPPAKSRRLAIAAAADLKFALEEVRVAFHRDHPEIDVETTFGASGQLFAQLSNGAPFDLFLSADIQYPQKLIEQDLAHGDSEFQYALGHLVVWVTNDSPLDVEKLGIEAVVDERVKKIAIANPQHAPYGRASEAALKKLDVYERAQDRLVLGENIVQTAQFVESGSADIGLIALSLALAPAMKDKGRFWEVPLDAYPPLEQGGVILKRCLDRETADLFRSFLMGEQGREILKQYGFVLPKE